MFFFVFVFFRLYQNGLLEITDEQLGWREPWRLKKLGGQDASLGRQDAALGGQDASLGGQDTSLGGQDVGLSGMNHHQFHISFL